MISASVGGQENKDPLIIERIISMTMHSPGRLLELPLLRRWLLLLPLTGVPLLLLLLLLLWLLLLVLLVVRCFLCLALIFWNQTWVTLFDRPGECRSHSLWFTPSTSLWIRFCWVKKKNVNTKLLRMNCNVRIYVTSWKVFILVKRSWESKKWATFIKVTRDGRFSPQIDKVEEEEERSIQIIAPPLPSFLI